MYYNRPSIIDENTLDTTFRVVSTTHTEQELKIVQIFENYTGEFMDTIRCALLLKSINASCFSFKNKDRYICEKQQIVDCTKMIRKKELSLNIYKSVSHSNITIYKFIYSDELKNIQNEYDNYGDFMLSKDGNKIMILDYDFMFTQKFTKLMRPDLYEISFDNSFRNKILNAYTNLFIHFN